MSPSVGQIILIILVILLIFGAGRLPRLMEDLAKGMKAFKKGMDDDNSKQVKSSHKSGASKKVRTVPVTAEGQTDDQKVIVFPAKKTGRVAQSKHNTAARVSARAETSYNTMNKSDKTARMPSVVESASKTKQFTTPYNDQSSVNSSINNDRPATRDTAEKTVSKVKSQNTAGSQSSRTDKAPTKKTASNAAQFSTTGSKTSDLKVVEPETKSKTSQKKTAAKPKTVQSITKKKAASKSTTSKNTTAKSGTTKKRAVKKTK